MAGLPLPPSCQPENSVLKSIVDVMKHANFQLYTTYPAVVIWEKGQLMTNI